MIFPIFHSDYTMALLLWYVPTSLQELALASFPLSTAALFEQEKIMNAEQLKSIGYMDTIVLHTSFQFKNEEIYIFACKKKWIFFIKEGHDFEKNAQSFTSLIADLRQNINKVSSFNRCHNGTFSWRNYSVKKLVY